jgi:hypothetical protein
VSDALASQLAEVPSPAPLHLAEPPRDEDAADRVVRARGELARLGREYQEAVGHALRARERADIAAGFDRSDDLQRRTLAAARRLRELERELAQTAEAEVHELPSHQDGGEVADGRISAT